MKTILPRVDTKAVARSVLNALAKQLIKTLKILQMLLMRNVMMRLIM